MAFIFDTPANGANAAARELRENLTALATSNITNTTTTPVTPREGMVRFNISNPLDISFEIYYNGAWRVLVSGIGGGATAAIVRKTQGYTSTATWLFDHNIGRKPLVQCLDSTGDIVYPSNINHVSDDRVVATHSGPVTGTMIVIG